MFCNHRDTAAQDVNEGKNAVTWVRLFCGSFKVNAVWVQLQTLAYNLANCQRALVPPEPVRQWPLATLRDRLVKIRAKSATTVAPWSSKWVRS